MGSSHTGYLLPLGLTVFAAVVALAIGPPSDARAEELLENGELSGSPPTHWVKAGANWDPDAPTATLLATSTTVTLSQGGIETAAGASLHAEITVAASGTPPINATLRLHFLDELFSPVTVHSSLPAVPGASSQVIALESTAPPGAAFLRFELYVTGPTSSFTVTVSNASLQLTAPAPSPTPTNTPVTPSPSPPASATPTATAMSPGSSPTPTKTPTATKTPKATATPTQPSGPNPTTPGSSNAQATPGVTQAPGPTSTPGPPPAWGLLKNGGFEEHDGDLPAYWEKYGGVPGITALAHGGSWAATLLSNSDSTKWLHQVVPVSGGEWYRGTAFGIRESGDGEFFLRISWYASVDASGSALSQVDSGVSSSANWTLLDTGAVQAPAAARSARFRLMLRPLAGFSAAFDDARFALSEAPTPAPSPTTAPTTGKPSPTPRAQPGAATTTTPRPGATLTGSRASLSNQEGPLTLRISEVMPNPDVAESSNDYEWIELFNWGADPVDLAGWTVADAKSADTLSPFVVAPHSYVVIHAKAPTFPAGIQSIPVPDGRIGSGLNNSGDTIALLAPNGSTVDAMSYGDDSSVLSPAPTAPGPGATLGRREAQIEASWSLTLRPTPGEANVFPATPTATSGPRTAPAASVTPTKAPHGDDERTPVDDDPGSPSPIPWILVGVASGIGGLASLTAADRRWPGVRRRVQRWRDGE